MAYGRYGQHDQSYIADSIADLADLPKSNMGSTCWVIATAEKYMVNSQGEWIRQTLSTNGSSVIIPGGNGETIDLSAYATIVYSDKEDARLKQHSDARDDAIVDSIDDTVASAVEEAVANIETDPKWDTIPSL